jgi:CRP/FNR family cyclic AMP-dependent transcriptional regulator
MSDVIEVKIKKDEVLFAKGEQNNDLYLVKEGKFAVCINDKSKVTAVAYIGEGEYIGEMSFFDHQPRSAHIICVEDATAIRIPVTQIDSQMPPWMILLAKSMTKKIRLLNDIINTKGIKKKSEKTVDPLSPQDQGRFYKLIKTYMEENGIN